VRYGKTALPQILGKRLTAQGCIIGTDVVKKKKLAERQRIDPDFDIPAAQIGGKLGREQM
jgi:hypothetical protein